MALQNVFDPEIGLDIVTLGLVYGLDITPAAIDLRLTFTTPNCPLGGSILEMAQQGLEGIAGSRRVEISLVFDPAWDPQMILPPAREALRRG